jgi:DNA-binding MarR family transcriptional regulator
VGDQPVELDRRTASPSSTSPSAAARPPSSGGEHLGVTKQAAVQLVDELEKRGYVSRQPHPEDRRARVVVLAPRGWACVERVVALWSEIERRWAALVGPERLTALREDLSAFVTAAGSPPIRPLW